MIDRPAVFVEARRQKWEIVPIAERLIVKYSTESIRSECHSTTS